MITADFFRGENFFLLAGPCVVESEAICDEIACKMASITKKLNINYVFKASYRKANRSRSDSFTGIGDIKGLEVIAAIGKKYGLATVTDIHSADEAAMAAKYVDILQIPAFLCRQSDILEAAAATGKWVNIKKGQFLAPEAIKFAAQKITGAGNNNVLLTDRGTSFGYHDLLVDFRAIPTMQQTGHPVITDITHSLQQPGTASGVTGGLPGMIETIARAAVAVGVDGIFMETHPNPAVALSDGANMIALDKVEELLTKLVKIRAAVSSL